MMHDAQTTGKNKHDGMRLFDEKIQVMPLYMINVHDLSALIGYVKHVSELFPRIPQRQVPSYSSDECHCSNPKISNLAYAMWPEHVLRVVIT